MGTATATRPTDDVAFASADELGEVMRRLLETVNADERVGPLIRAAKTRTRFEFTDLDLALNIASDPPESDRSFSWDFADPAPWSPKLSFRMSSATANSYLQGRESLPVLIARGRVECECESRAALLFLPLIRLFVRPYRELIELEYPHLALR